MRAIKPTKEELRKKLLTIKGDLVNRHKRDEEILQNVLDMPEFIEAETILSYVSREEDEIDTKRLIALSMSQGKKVYAPVMQLNDTIEYYRVNSIMGLQRNRFNVLEPRVETSEKLESAEGLFCITPAIACDKKYNRLGFGKGYFDKFFSENKVFSVALCYDELLVSELAVDKWDKKVDVIVTENKLHRRQAK